MFTFIIIPKTITVIEILISEMIFCFKLKKRKHFWLAFALTALAMLSWAIFIPVIGTEDVFLSSMYGIFMFLPIWLFSLVGLFFMFEEERKYLFLIGVAGFTVQKLASLVNSCVNLINPEVLSFINLVNLSFWPFLSVTLSDIAVFVACYFLFSRRMVNYQKLVINKNVYWISIIACLTNLVFGFVYTFIQMEAKNLGMEVINYTQNIMCCVLVLLIVSGIFQKGEVEKELQYNQQVYATARENFKNEKQTIEIINQKCHDLKHRVVELMSGNNVDYSDILDAINIYDSSIHTNNEALDMVIRQKLLIANKSGITFNLMVDASKLSFMKNADIFIMFGNLFDNAMNAVLKLPEGESKEIYVRISDKNNVLFIGFENRYGEKLNYKNGKFATTNVNKENHGFGLKSIQETVNKYDGTIVMKAENNTFKTQIAFILK